jgi:hypothetical protein
MATFGRMRLDIENCSGNWSSSASSGAPVETPSQYSAIRPRAIRAAIALLDTFLETTRGHLASRFRRRRFQTLREMIGRDEKKCSVVFEWIRHGCDVRNISVLIPPGPPVPLSIVGGPDDSRAEPAPETEKFPGSQSRSATDTLFES